jgi:NitT/TauT family transport system substrate-binding protein
MTWQIDRRAAVAARRPRGRRSVVGPLVGLLALAATGCGGATAAPTTRSAPAASPAAPASSVAPAAASGSGSGAAASPLPVKISYAGAGVANLPFYVAQDEGFFARQGLKVTMVRMAENVSTSALANGEIPFVNNPGVAIAGAVKGLPFRVVYSAWASSPWDLVGKTSIASLADIRGHKVGTEVPGTTPYAFLQAGMQRAHLPMSDITLVPFHGTPFVYSALVAGEIDAGVLSPPTDLKAEAHGFHRIAFLGDALQVPYIGLGTTTGYIASHRAVVVGVIRALWQATAWARAHPAGAEAVIVKNLGTTQAEAQDAYREVAPTLTETGETTPLGVQQYLNILAQATKTQVKVAPSAVVDYGPLQQALQGQGAAA